jgi:hypothetical protein
MRAVCAARNIFAGPKESGGYRPVFSTAASAAAGGFIGMSFYLNAATGNGIVKPHRNREQNRNVKTAKPDIIKP